MTITANQPSIGISGGLQDNFMRLVAMMRAGSLSQDALGSFSRVINAQILSAEQLALSTAKGAKGFEDARAVLGYKDAKTPASVLAFPKPKPILPKGPKDLGGACG